jgi:hypothetical protein
MQPEPRPGRRVYIDTLRRIGPEKRLEKAFELSEMTHEALRVGLRQRHPDASREEIERLFRERLERCRSRTS